MVFSLSFIPGSAFMGYLLVLVAEFLSCVLNCRSHVTFGFMSPAQMQQASHVQVINKNLYSQDGSGKAVPHGVLDHRMVKLMIVSF